MNQTYANTTTAIDSVFWFIAGFALLLLVLVTGLMIGFAVRYHHRRHPVSEPVRDNIRLEIIWTLLPTLLVLAMFWYGYRVFLTTRNVPADALVVKTTGQMWKWTFVYPNGKQSDVLHVPLNRPIKLELKSLDVIHSFYVPAFRLKEDVVPGRENYLWFKPQGIGAADVFCSQYCGLNHSRMITRIEVQSDEEFAAWYAGSNAVARSASTVPRLWGVRLMAAKGCLVCHRLDDTRGIGPDLRRIFGRKTTVVVNGQEREIVADEAYLRRSILEPGREIVKGYTDMMPPVTGLSEQDLQLLIETLKELK